MLLWFQIFIIIVQTKCDPITSNEINYPELDESVEVYWNIPTFQCDSHKLNFTDLALKYRMNQNLDDRFRGEIINILYDPGSFPAILKDSSSNVYLRNGGVPQEGNLTLHLTLFKDLIEQLIPEEDFAGVAVIDFESWRPIYRQNFGTLAPYKDLSMQIERKIHPLWPQYFVEKEATKRFEFYGRQFMEESLVVAKEMRKNASWGFYGYPYCFNMSPNNMRKECPQEVLRENERLNWLFNLTDNFHPSIYLESRRLNSNEKVEMVEGRIHEAHRLIGYLHKKTHPPKILPYFWYKYHDTKKFLSKDDAFNILTVLASSDVDGLVLWGSSNDVNTKDKCLDLYQYIDDVLGPLLMNF